MRKFVAVLGALVCLLPTAPTSAQGGAMLGGGMAMGRRGALSDVVTVTSILTPGQFTEYPLTVKAGETVIAEVETNNFDSALQLVDAAGKVLGENDDRREGEQDARLLYRFSQPGSYKLLVRAFKGAAGGQFELNLRRFVPQELAVGASASHGGNLTVPSYYAVTLTEPQTLLLRLSGASNPELTVYDPTGEPVPALARFGDRQRLALKAVAPGNYFLRLETVQPCGLKLDVARRLAHTLGQKSEPQVLPTGGLDLWRFQAEEGQLIQLTAVGESAALHATLEQVLPEGLTFEAKGALAAKGPLPLPVPAKAGGEQVVVLRSRGTYELAVAQAQGQAVRYQLASRATVRRWDTTAPLTEHLPLGKAEFFQLSGKTGELLVVEGRSEQFDVALELYDAQGTPVASNDDSGVGRDAQIRTLLTTTGDYFLRVHAFGDGGSGSYALKRTIVPLRSLRVGERQEGTLALNGTEIYSFEGKSGQALLLSARSSECDTLVRVYGPDGNLLARDDDSGGGTNSLLAFTTPTPGRYTVWVTSKLGTGKYTLRLIEAD